MIRLGDYIQNKIEQQGRTKVWVADQCNINYKTFTDKLKNDRFTAYDIFKVADVLCLDLTELKEKFK